MSEPKAAFVKTRANPQPDNASWLAIGAAARLRIVTPGDFAPARLRQQRRDAFPFLIGEIGRIALGLPLLIAAMRLSSVVSTCIV